MASVQFGWGLPVGARHNRRATFVADVERGLALIRGHFDSAWVIDHLLMGDSDVLEAWTELTFFAARHPGLHGGHAVLSQSFRNPALLAKMAASLHFLTGGQYILGLGAGWHEPEYRAYGYPFPSAGVRVDELEEAVSVVKALWGALPASFVGRYYRVQEALCEPRPDPPPIISSIFFTPCRGAGPAAGRLTIPCSRPCRGISIPWKSPPIKCHLTSTPAPA